MKVTMKASDVGSTLTHEPGGRGRAIWKTLDRGQYAIAARNIVMENAKTGETFALGDSTPVSSKELFEYQMQMPKARLEGTLPGIVGNFFAERGTWSDKGEWTVKYTEV